MADIEFNNVEKLRFDVFRCVRCGNCMDVVDTTNDLEFVCPVGTLHPDGSWEHYYARGRLQNIMGYLEDDLEFNESQIEAIFCDPMCSNCETHCTVNHYYLSGAHPRPAVPVMEIFEALRQDIYKKYPEHRVFKALRDYHKVRSKTDDLKKFQVEMDIPSGGERMYFAGCNGPCRADEVWMDSCRVLKAAGVEFAMQTGAGTCCGYVYLRNGMDDLAEKFARQHLKKVQENGTKEIITSCACCHRTLKVDYPRILGDEWTPEVKHVTELVGEALEDGRLKLKNRLDATVTYHDPCNLTKPRDLYDHEVPRRILDSIPGVELKEMSPAKKNALCCGAGGGMIATNPGVAGIIGENKVEKAKATKADILVSACPFCEENLSDAASVSGEKLQVIDIMELVNKTLEG